MKSGSGAPRLAIWLLTRRLSPEWRDFIAGDLEEEFATRVVESRLAAHAHGLLTHIVRGRSREIGIAFARVLKTLVFGVSASDPLTLAAVGATSQLLR